MGRRLLSQTLRQPVAWKQNTGKPTNLTREVRHDHRATAVSEALGSNRSRGLPAAPKQPRLGCGRLGFPGVQKVEAKAVTGSQPRSGVRAAGLSRRGHRTTPAEREGESSGGGRSAFLLVIVGDSVATLPERRAYSIMSNGIARRLRWFDDDNNDHFIDHPLSLGSRSSSS